ncbi:MAG: 3',5'-cyclic AMP phosphodiesterase CpdA [Maribacter sp.]|jgi:3',5'-cyclic AMP phosphodiesterase CpdA
MKNLLLALFLLIAYQVTAQNLTRFPYIQATSTTSTIVAWRTSSSTVGEVNYGTNQNNLNQVVLESSANSLHGLTLDNLQPDTKYYYSISADGTILASEFFWTASDASDQEFSFLHYGDCGYNSALQHQVGDLMEADDASFAVVCGDVDQGGVPHLSSDEGGDNYDEIYFDVYNDGVESKMLAHECHYTAVGNHDTYLDNCATYTQEFFLPHNNAEDSERYYSFEWGDAKFIALDVITPYDDTTFPINFADIEDRWWTDFRQGSPQYQFLEEELKCNERKWVLVYFHEGPWTNYWGVDYNIPSNLGGDYFQYDGNQMVRQHLVPLFEQYEVDMVLCGHSHLYERGEKNGVLYITSGSAGDDDLSSNNQVASHPEILLSLLDNVYAKYMITENSVMLNVINKDNNVVDTYNHTKEYTDYEEFPIITNATCAEATDGSATILVTGPKSPYTIEWFDGTLGGTITNQAPGTYYAVVTNVHGCEKVTSVIIDAGMADPVADFDVTGSDNLFTFNAVDEGGTSYFWDFGNGDSETTSTPTVGYQYPLLGTYTVTLTITSVCGTNMQTETVSANSYPVDVFDLADDAPFITVSPNPFTGQTQIDVKNLSGKMRVKVYDIAGKEIQSFKTRDESFILNLGDIPSGKYFLNISDKKGDYAVKDLLVK